MDIDIKIVKQRVETKSRKLKGTWLVNDDWESFFSQKVKIIPDDEVIDEDYPYGVTLQNVSSKRLDDIFFWVKDTYDQKDYNTTGNLDQYIWFAKERHRTLLLMKWS